MTSLESCDFPPFKYQSTPQPTGDAGSSSNQINEQALEGYLQRFKEAICRDLEALDARIQDLEQ